MMPNCPCPPLTASKRSRSGRASNVPARRFRSPPRAARPDPPASRSDGRWSRARRRRGFRPPSPRRRPRAPGGSRRVPCSASTTCPQSAPPCARTRSRPRGRTRSRRVVSTTSPPTVRLCPPWECPPPRIAIRVPSAAARRTVLDTSSTLSGLATADGTPRVILPKSYEWGVPVFRGPTRVRHETRLDHLFSHSALVVCPARARDEKSLGKV